MSGTGSQSRSDQEQPQHSDPVALTRQAQAALGAGLSAYQAGNARTALAQFRRAIALATRLEAIAAGAGQKAGGQ